MSNRQTLIDLAKDAPVVGLAGATLFGITLQDWVFMLGALWAIWRIVDGVFDTYWKWKDRRNGKHRD